MQGARLVNTPAMKRIGSAVSGFDDSCVEICEKSTIVLNAEEGCYLEASLFAIIYNGKTTFSSGAPRTNRSRADRETVPTRTAPSFVSPDPCWSARPR